MPSSPELFLTAKRYLLFIMSAKSKSAKPGSDSTDRSPPSVTSNPTVENPSSKLITAPYAQLQAELNLAEKGLKKANKELVLLEEEKAKALSKVKRVKKAHKLYKEANEKLLREEAQKRAEEKFKIEKSRAIELEQATIEASQRKEEEWQKKLEQVKNDHALDLAAMKKTALAAQKRAEEKSKIEKSRAIELEQAAIEASQRKEEEWQKKLEQVKNEYALDLAAMKKTEKHTTKLSLKADLVAFFRSLEQDLKESENRLKLAKEENFEVVNKFELVKSEIEIIKEEKAKLVDELETSRNEEEKKRNKALENLHEVSSKALFSIKVENENYRMQIEDLKAKNEKSERMLADAKREINAFPKYIEWSDALLKEKELHFTNTLKRSEEGNSSLRFEICRLANLLKKVEKEACEKEAWWKNSVEEANSEAIGLKKVTSDAKAESARLRESLVDRENELEKNVSENDELRKREMALLVQVEVLSNLLEEALAEKNKQEDANGELTDSSEKDYDVLPKWTSFMQINEKHVEVYEVESLSGKLKNGEGKEEENEDYFSEVDMEMWESFKIDEKDSYIENDANGVMMMMKKKKKPLLGKIGSLLKKG